MLGQIIPYVDKTTEDDPQKGFIQGDVFLVPEEIISRLDNLEQHPRWYRREIIDVNVKGSPMKAWCYLNKDAKEMAEKGHTPTHRQNDGIYSF